MFVRQQKQCSSCAKCLSKGLFSRSLELIYNGLLQHGTTEFEVLGPNDSRMYIALFVKRETV